MNHPIIEYIPHAKSFINIISKEPELLITNDKELEFFTNFLNNLSSILLKNDDEHQQDFDDSDDGDNNNGVINDNNDDIIMDVEEDVDGELNHANTNNRSNKESYWDNDINPYTYSLSSLSNNNISSSSMSSNNKNNYDVIIVGGGAAGIGNAISLMHGGMRKSNMLILEHHTIGYSFDNWKYDTTFISPSFYSNPFGSVDLNSIDPYSSPAAICGNTQRRLTGDDYAMYLRVIADKYSIPIQENIKVLSITPQNSSNSNNDNNNDDRHVINCDNNENKNIQYYARHVIWCGGEWSYPSTISSNNKNNDNDNNKEGSSTIHYSKIGKTKINWSDYAMQATRHNTPIIVIGGFESGVDAACSIINLGTKHKVIIIDENVHSNDKSSDDPSMSLSISSNERLQHALHQSNQLDVLYGWTYQYSSIVTTKDDNNDTTYYYQASIVNKNTNEIKTMQSTARILLCNGFDTRLSIIKDLFHFNSAEAKNIEKLYGNQVIHNNMPIVSQSCDESLLCKNIYLSGPMLRHTVTICNDNTNNNHNECANRYMNKNADKKTFSNEDNNNKKLQELIFCFIYKFRARFAIISGEILSRLVYNDHCKINDEEQQFHIDDVGNKRLEKIENMLELYKSKGMYVSNLNDCALHDSC